jgi:hypothetical protein
MENQDDPRRHSKEGYTSESRIKVHKQQFPEGLEP